MNDDTRKEFESRLLAAGLVPPTVLAQIRNEPSQAMPSILVMEHGCDRVRLLEILADLYQMPVADMRSDQVDLAAMGDLPPEFCLKTMALPLRAEEGTVQVAFADPDNLAAVDEMQAALGKPVHAQIALACDIQQFLDTTGALSTVDELVADVLGDSEEPPLRVSSRSEVVNPVVRLLDKIVKDAIRREALHLYIVPSGEDDIRVRFGLQKKIVEAAHYPARLHSKFVNRLRVLCDLLGKDKRVPQSGAFQIAVGETKHRLDVMIVPAEAGDAVTIFFDQTVSLSSNACEIKCKECNYSMQEDWRYCPHCGKTCSK